MMMWDVSNFWGEGKSTPMNSYLQVMHEIHVVLVDHDPEGLMNTSNMLEMCQYKVTVFELASAAITMLTNGKVKVDMVIANINSPDLHGFKLLQLAANLDIPIILMSLDDNSFMAMKAIENGAFLYIKKPPTIDLLRFLWQHVARERLRAARARAAAAANYAPRGGIEFREAGEENPNSMLVTRHGGMGAAAKGYYKGRSGGGGGGGGGGYDSDIVVSHGRVRRKVCTEWTQELHEKFMAAVEELGEGRCFPKEILELMNVPGLTRMQVASHLQKCRNDNWRSPEERKANAANPQSCDSDGSQPKMRRFGSMPRVGGRGPSSQGGGEGSRARPEPEPEMENDGGGMGDGGSVATATFHHEQQYSALVAHQGITSSNPPRLPSSADDYFCFQDMDCLIQNFSGVPQGPAGMPHPISAAAAAYHFDPAYAYDQNSRGPMLDNRSQWTNSETSNFRSDD